MSLESLVEQLVRPEIRALSSYHVADASGMIKLDAMENPYVWDESLRKAWLDRLASVDVNRYPDPHAPAVTASLRKLMNVPQDLDILLGNGSDELIQLIIYALAKPGAVVMAPEPTFVMYRMISKFAGVEFAGVPLLSHFGLDMPGLVAEIHKRQPAVLFLAQPNNPTGIKYPADELEILARTMSGLLVIDEAYLPFTDGDALSFAERFDNVVIMRTLSKVGLAGLRLGLLIGRSQWLCEFDKLRLPYNINVLTQVSTVFALEHYEVFAAQAQALREERSRLHASLSAMPEIQVWASEANFLLLKTLSRPAQQVFEAIKAQGVLIKKLDGAHPLLADCLRVTVGTPAENAAFLSALAKALA